MKLLSHFASNHINLVAVLTTSWSPLAGASPEVGPRILCVDLVPNTFKKVIAEVKQVLGSNANVSDAQSALEVAISTQAKQFISSPVAQKVVNDIYTGRIVFSTAATRSMLADNYKPKAITIYDSRDAPFLDHYRLRVPKYGAILEFLNFACLLVTFVLCLSSTVAFCSSCWPSDNVSRPGSYPSNSLGGYLCHFCRSIHARGVYCGH